MKKGFKLIVPSLLAIIVCVLLLAGSTFALFTSDVTKNIVVGSAKVNMTAEYTDFKAFSVEAVDAYQDGDLQAGSATAFGVSSLYRYKALTANDENKTNYTFANKGTATLTNQNTIELVNVTPGDRITANLKVTNNSNVDIIYHVRLNAISDNGLLDGLTVKAGGETLDGVIKVGAWKTWTTEQTKVENIALEVFLPVEAGNEYQTKQATLRFTIEAVQANAKVDTLLDQVNAYLATHDGNDDGKNDVNNTMYDAIQEVKGNTELAAFDATKYLWSPDTDQFYAPYTVVAGFESHFFKAYTATEYAELNGNYTYNIYALGNWSSQSTITLTTASFDAGDSTGITQVNYTRAATEPSQTMVIRTNSASTNVAVNAPNDVVYRYGEAGTVTINAIAGNSYHENGVVGFLEIVKGRVALEADAKVANVHIVSKKEVVNNVEQTTNKFDEIIVAIHEDAPAPTFSRDDVEIASQGTLVVALQQGTEDVTEETELDYVWLTKQGIYEQIKVSESNKSAGNTWVDQLSGETTAEQQKVQNTQTAAMQIANNIGRDATTNEIKVEVSVTKQEETKTYAVVLDGNRDLVVVDKADTSATPEVVATLDETTSTVQIGTAQFTVALTSTSNNNEAELTVTNVEDSEEVHKSDAVTNGGLTEDQITKAKEEVNDAVARIDTTYYKTFADAYDAAKVTDTIFILKDFTLSSVALFNKNTTINGQNHEIKSSATRIFRVSQPNIDVKIYDFVMTSICTAQSDVRGISFDDVASNSSLLLDSCELSASFYAINAIPGANNLNVTIKNGTVAAGWAAINTYSNNATFNIENSTLRGLNDKGESSWNNFNTITIDGNGLNYSSANNGSNNTVNIINSTVYSDSNSTNKQYWVGLQYGALNNTVNVDSDSRIINSDGDDLTDNFKVGWYHNYIGGSYRSYYDNSSNKIIVANEEKEFFTPDVYYHWSVGNLYEGEGIAFEKPFTNGLDDGKFITLLRNVTLNNDVTVPFESGSFHLTLGDYTISGTGHIILPQGVTLITDKAIDSLLVNLDGFEIIKSQLENGYLYKVSALKGSGTQENPFLVYDYATMQKISDFYDLGYYYFAVDLAKTDNGNINCTGWVPVKLHGSFDGKGVKFNNVTAVLFQTVGYQLQTENVTLKDFDATMNVSANGQYGASALVKNIFNGGVTTFDHVNVHGYLEGFWNMGSFYNYGTANYDDHGCNYEVVFTDCYSDATLVCASGNTIGGLFGHSYEGSGNSFTLRVNNTAYEGKMFLTTSSGKGNKYFGMTSDYYNANNHFYFNGVEDTFTNGDSKNAGAYTNSTKITKIDAEGTLDGYVINKQANVSKIVVTITAQLTAYDNNNVKIDNLSGITMTLSSTELTELEGTSIKVLDLFGSININNNASEFGASVIDNTLNINIASSSNYRSGNIRLQVNQYDSDGNIISAGTIDLATCSNATSEWDIK